MGRNSGTCAVAVCNSPADATYHRFPRDPDLSKKWVFACKRKDQFSLTNARICSKHFREEDYERDMYRELLNLPIRNILKQNSVPSKYLLPDDDQDFHDVPRKRVVRTLPSQFPKLMFASSMVSPNDTYRQGSIRNVNSESLIIEGVPQTSDDSNHLDLQCFNQVSADDFSDEQVADQNFFQTKKIKQEPVNHNNVPTYRTKRPKLEDPVDKLENLSRQLVAREAKILRLEKELVAKNDEIKDLKSELETQKLVIKHLQQSDKEK